MRINVAGLLVATALIGVGCGGSGSSSEPVMTPTAPSVPNLQPATVNISTIGNAGWSGQSSSDQGSGGFALSVTQSGSQLTGTINAIGHSGLVAGTISGNMFAFNFSQTGNQTQPCGALSGTATVTSVNTMTSSGSNTTNSMTGTFSGKDCAGNSVTNGTFTAAYDMTFNSATRFPIAGTWKAPAPPPLGGGSWTWTLAQNGDINSGNLSGSVTFSPDTLNLGVGTITGTVTNVYPGPPQWTFAATSVSFTGTCPATLTITWGDVAANAPALSPDGLHLTGSLSGSTCNGSLATFTINLARQ
jgi:hypothetical protein